MRRVFLLAHAGPMIDLFENIIAAENRGDPIACRILDDLDRAYGETGSPDSDLLVTIAVQRGWFEERMQQPRSRAGNGDRE